jgi:septal ring factor EnvC (AmiA/AmiB activator)
MSANLRLIKSRLNNFANFMVMVMVAALLLFAIYLARQNRRVRLEYESRMLTAEKEIEKLQHTINKKDFLIEQLRKQLKQRKRQGTVRYQ